MAGSTIWVALRGNNFDGSTKVLLVSHTWQDVFHRMMKEVIDEHVDAVEDWRLAQKTLHGTWPEEVPRPNVPQTRDELEQLLQDPAAGGRSLLGSVVEFEPQGVVEFFNAYNDLFHLIAAPWQPETDDVPPPTPQPPRKRRNKSISRC